MNCADTSYVPNVLLVLTDQWPAARFSHRGSPVQTPNVDALAPGGTVFTNAFRWPWRTGVIDNYGIGYSTQEPMETSIHTWIDAAARSVFEVGYFGKWHLGPDGPALHGAHQSRAESTRAGARTTSIASRTARSYATTSVSFLLNGKRDGPIQQPMTRRLVRGGCMGDGV